MGMVDPMVDIMVGPVGVVDPMVDIMGLGADMDTMDTDMVAGIVDILTMAIMVTIIMVGGTMVDGGILGLGQLPSCHLTTRPIGGVVILTTMPMGIIMLQ